MKVCWWLVRAMFKSANWNQAFGSLRKKNKNSFLSKLSGPGRMLLVLAVFLYCGYFFAYTQAKLMAPSVLAGLPLSSVSGLPAIMTVALVLTVTLMTSLMLLIQGDDLPQYFLLPVRRSQIVLARCILLLGTGSLWIPVMFYLPYGFLLAYLTGQSLGVYLIVLFQTFLFCVIPACVVSTVLLLFARVFSFMRNRDKMMHVANVLVLIVSMGMGGIIGMSNSRNSISGAQASGPVFKVSFLQPILKLLDHPGSGQNLLAVLAFAVLAIAVLGLLVFLYQKMLVRLTIGSRSSEHRALKPSDWKRLRTPGSVWKTMLRREWSRTTRSPAFFMGVVVQPLIFPIFALIGLIAFAIFYPTEAVGGWLEFRSANAQAIQQYEGSSIFSIALIVLVAIVFFFGGQSAMSNASLTREGIDSIQLKLLPIASSRVFAVKWVFSMILALPGLILIYIVAPVVFGVPLKWLVHIILLSSLMQVLIALWAHGFDWCFPRLDWENEIYAAKQNLNILIEYFATLLIGGALCALIYLGMYLKLPFGILLGSTYGVLLLLLVVTLLLLPLMIRRGWRKIAS